VRYQAHTVDLAGLYTLGSSWLHRAHPLTKLALVPALTTAAVAAGGYAVPTAAVVFLVMVALVSGVGRLTLSSLRILLPIAVALLAIHVPFNPGNETAIAHWGPVTLYREGLDFALVTLSRLAVFVVTITLALRTTHPKALVTALVERGVSHKIAYSYLAGAELIPDMRRRAREILDAQRSRGFDTEGSLVRRAQTLLALLKPLLVGALVSVETRSLELESRGFSLPGKRTSTVVLEDSWLGAAIRWLALLATLAGVIAMVAR
jgi:energy-coupling factor transport system permease protein